MTVVPLVVNSVHPVCDSMRTLRTVMPRAGFGLPAAAIAEKGVARWVADRGVTVMADDDDLELVRAGHIRPVQVILTCNGEVDQLRRAVSAGVTRFATHDDGHIDILASRVHRSAYVYIDADERIPEPRRRIDVVGVRCRIDDAGDPTVWAAEAERMLCRLALLNKCGFRPRRLCMVDTSTALDVDTSAIASHLEAGIRSACERWRLPRPAVTYIPAVPAAARAAAPAAA